MNKMANVNSSPLLNYVLTSCNDFPVFPHILEGNTSPILLGRESPSPLVSQLPILLECDEFTGVRPLTNWENVTEGTGSQLDREHLPMLSSSLTSSLQRLGYNSTASTNSETGLTISLWITPSPLSFTKQDEQLPILTIGRSKHNESDAAVANSGCPGYDILLAQYQNHLLLSFTDNDNAKSCRILNAVSAVLTTDKLTNIVVMWSGSRRRLDLYQDGLPVVKNAPTEFDTNLTARWDSSSNSNDIDMTRLQLFSNDHSSAIFEGFIHQVSITDQTFQGSTIKVMYQEGPTIEPIVVVAQTSDNASLPQGLGKSKVLWLGNSDRFSTETMQLYVEILSLPRHGILTFLDSDSNRQHIRNSNRLSIPIGSKGVSVNYTLMEADYFNTPPITAYGTDLGLESEYFEFRLIAVIKSRGGIDDSGNAAVVEIGASPPVSQALNVIHTNHCPSLTVPPAAIWSEEDTAIIVKGIELVDPLDLNVDLVRVDVWSSIGRLALHADHRSLADFSSCRTRTFSEWQCVGDGKGDRNMTFVAMPDDVSVILDRLKYQPLVSSGEADEINVRVSDGQGGACLSNHEHQLYVDEFGNSFSTIHSGCFQIQGTIAVIPMKDGSGKYDVYDSGIPGIPNTNIGHEYNKPRILFWLISWWLMVLLIIGCIKCCGRYVPSFLAGSNAILPDDDVEPSDLDNMKV